MRWGWLLVVVGVIAQACGDEKDSGSGGTTPQAGSGGMAASMLPGQPVMSGGSGGASAGGSVAAPAAGSTAAGSSGMSSAGTGGSTMAGTGGMAGMRDAG